ncbi:MAG TPA: hypothetical protein VG326_20055 [Tepidisphaeraceae bacterium]|jgi:hypothetical protein|nr:hypothetical protein [Tepidisphaeraceae bacterium]
MTYHDLYRKLHDEPLKPFRVRLTNSTVIDVREPGSVIVGESSAVLPVEMILDDRGVRVARNWKTKSLAHIVEFSDFESKAEDRRSRP